MKTRLHHLSRSWPFLVWCGVGLVLFWPVLGYYVALPAPDAAPFFPYAHRLRTLEQMLAGMFAITPHHIFSLLLPPLVTHDLIYLVDSLLIAAGCAYLLRGRDLPPAAAWIGGGILAFSGYSFTLVSAGHIGYFHMAVYVTFMFGFIVRAVCRGQWPYFALAGLFGAWAILFAPDFGLLFLLLAAAYGLWLLLRNAAQQPWKVRLRQLAIGLPIAAFCFMLGALLTIRTIFTVHLKTRQQQIAGTVAQPAKPDTPAQDAPPADPKGQWIFATNWSLPPAEIVEFVAPCLFGTQSGDPKAPYWGKLGRTLGWEQHRQGYPNFRQHAIYLGGLQLMLAAFAIGCWWQGRERKPDQLDQSRITNVVDNVRDKARDKDYQPKFQEADLRVARCALNIERSDVLVKEPRAPWLTDVPFWAGVWVIGLLLAFGRHAPLYRLFYSLPYMSFLRAPVKFMRLVEFATAILAATGVASLLIAPFTAKGRRLRGWVIAAGACVGLGLLAALWTNGSGESIRSALEPLGLSPLGGALQGNMIRAFMHAAVAFGVAAAVFHLRGRLRDGAVLIPLLIVVWIAVDGLLVNRRFIMAWDLAPWYQPNSIVKQVLVDGGLAPVVANHVTPHVQQDWFSSSFTANGIFNCVPSPQAPADNYFHQLYERLQPDPLRYWELCGASHVVLPLQAARSLAGPRLKPISTLQLANGEIRAASDESRAAVLARVPEAMPYAWLTPSWSVVPATDSLQATATQASRQRTIVVGEVPAEFGAPDAPAGTVTIVKIRHHAGALKTVIIVDAPTAQFLTLRIHAQENPKVTSATIDHAPIPILRANHTWIGLPVPPGRHQIEFSAAQDRAGVSINILPFILMLLLLPVVACSRRTHASL